MATVVAQPSTDSAGSVGPQPPQPPMAGDSRLARLPALRPCQHQVAGHLFEEGKAGSLVDDFGHFYKPLQAGARGQRELEFYSRVFGMGRPREGAESGRKLGVPGTSGRGDAWDGLAMFVPRFKGTVELGGTRFLVLEDVGVSYRRPCVIDIKIGFRTWYAGADEQYVARARAKDGATTQASLGFKICGWQVYKHGAGRFCRASKSTCKKMSQSQVRDSLLCFADNEAGLNAASVFGGPFGVVAQLRDLAAWFSRQRELVFYSSSVLVVYEGDATRAEDGDVRVRLVDFAHTFESNGQRDDNFAQGLASLMEWLEETVRVSQGGGEVEIEVEGRGAAREV